METDDLKELFNKLDRNKDGKIEFNELTDYFNEAKSSENQSNNQAQFLFDSIKTGDSNKMNFDFRDFVEYINQKDKKVSIFFKDLDKNKDGLIDKNEIKDGFEKLGIILSNQQIEKLMSHLDKNNNLNIDLKEWKNFFRFAPHDKFEDALRHWRAESFLDFSDQSIPKDYTKNEKESGLWYRSLIAGGLAGSISRSCTAPLDRVRIFLQVHGSETKLGIIGSAKSMVKEGGLSSLWRGNLINVLKITPESAIKFTAYEQIKILMGQEGQQLPLLQKFLSGSLAGFISQSTIYPMEVLKTRLALRKSGQYNGISDCMRNIYKAEGIKAFYRGYLMNSLGIAGVGVDLALYETLKVKYCEMYPNQTQPSWFALLVIANTSSTTAMFSTYPLFLIRTRMQSSNNKNDTIISIAKRVLKNDGVFGFYRGSFANLAKVAPSATIGYLSYETIQKFMGIKH